MPQGPDRCILACHDGSTEGDACEARYLFAFLVMASMMAIPCDVLVSLVMISVRLR